MKNYPFIALLLCASISAVPAHEQSSTHYKMSKNVLSNGGNLAHSSNYQRLSTIGQYAIKRGDSNNTVLQAGFHHPNSHSISPATCLIYAVDDKKRNDSQIFTIDKNNLEINKLGNIYQGYDIESIAIHPRTTMIYAASGDDATNGKKGHLYIVDGKTGELFPICNTGVNEIEELAFDPEGTLWAWAKGDGLITIDPKNCATTLELASDILVEGLSLSKAPNQTIFYGSVNSVLWVYDMKDDKLEVACTNLLGETEALEMKSNGILLVGTHKVPFGLHAINPQTCEIIMADTLSHQFDDVEGIALPIEACIK